MPSHLLLVRPAAFGFNPETAATNLFQKNTPAAAEELLLRAQDEFDGLVQRLRDAKIAATVVQDVRPPVRPDAVFPNNWFSVHGDTLILYPMLAPNRRIERRTDIIDQLKEQFGIRKIIDFTHHERSGRFLEGTGSLVLDHEHQLAYAAVSPRTDPGLVRILCRAMNWKPVLFRTKVPGKVPVYHTNVLMALHPKLAVVCTEAIDPRDRTLVLRTLKETQHELLEISLPQMNAFAGNMLFVLNAEESDYVILSEQAWKSLGATQQQLLQQHAGILHAPLYTIETYGGGSARCMLAEV